MMVFKFSEGWVFRRTHQWSQHGEMQELGEYMRVQTKLTGCCQLECYLKKIYEGELDLMKAVMDVTSKMSSKKSDENIDPDQILFFGEANN